MEEDLVTAAVRLINTTSSHIFLTGKAGTGKTTFLKNLHQHTHKSHIIVAPTGIAALNAGGVTIHSQFLLPPSTFVPDRDFKEDPYHGGNLISQHTLARKHPLNSQRKKVLRSIDLLVIDEVSMLRADLLDAIDYRMRSARGNFRQHFGGAQVLFIGDLFQLPPVVKNEDWEILRRYYKTPWFYDAKVLVEKPPIYLELDKVYRQHDAAFIGILNNLRHNTATEEDIQTLNRHYKTAAEIDGLEGLITLTTHNRKADEINEKALRALPAHSSFHEARMEGDFPESMYPVLPRLELKEGAQVMFIRNDVDEKQYFNGKLAKVKRIEEQDVWVEMSDTGELYHMSRVRWENKKYSVDETTSDLNEEVIGSFEQYPLRLAWAITVHKSQGLTFDHAILDINTAFADGQVYVALSRLRSLEGLVLRSLINPAVISTNADVVSYMEQHHRPGELPKIIQASQWLYLKDLINKTFEFRGLLKDIEYARKDEHASAFDESTMKPPLALLAEALEGEQSNTQVFRKQLEELLAANDQEKLLERIQKGTDYYRRFLSKIVPPFLEHVESMRFRKRVKTYLSHLEEIDVALMKKWEELDKIFVLAAGIMQGESQFEFAAHSQRRTEIRNAWLTAIHEVVKPPPKRKRGRKKKQDDKSTYDITRELLGQGMSAAEIAAERGLAVGTIELHLAKLVEKGSADLFSFVQEADATAITKAMQEMAGEFSMKDLYIRLEGKYSYGVLHAVRAHYRNSEPQAD